MQIKHFTAYLSIESALKYIKRLNLASYNQNIKYKRTNVPSLWHKQ